MFFEKRFQPSANPPLWFREWALASGGSYESASGVSVTPDAALGVSAYFRGINLLATTQAMLPLHLMRRTDDSREKAVGSILYRVLHDAPNPEMTAKKFRETLQAHILSWGNGYAEIVRNRGGQVMELWPLRPDRMRVFRGDDRKLYYEYRLSKPDNQGRTKRVLPAERIFHIPGFGFDGVTGYSVVEKARQTLGLSIAAEQFGARFYANDATPGVVLRHPGTLSEEAYSRMKNQWGQRHGGLENSHRMDILEEGIEVEQIGLPPGDIQFLETRKFQTIEIARWLGVPPHLLYDLDRATFSNIEQQSLEYVTYSLAPHLVDWEQYIWLKLLTESEKKSGYYAKFNVNALLRADMQTRYAAYAIGRQWGFKSANDVRDLEDENPIKNGDIYLHPLNMVEAGSLSSAPEAGRSSAGEGETRGKRANPAAARHRLMNAYRRLYRDTAARTVRREVNDVRGAVQKYLVKRDDAQGFLVWLTDFYGAENHAAFIEKNFLPLAASYAEATADEAADEANGERPDEAVEKFTRVYVHDFAARECGRSATALRETTQAYLDDGNADAEALFEETLGDWNERRPSLIELTEPVRFGNGIARAVFAALGALYLRSVAFGDNCPYCDALDGQTIGITEYFIEPGGSFQPDGADKPLTVKVGRRHPPYHGGCDCMITVG